MAVYLLHRGLLGADESWVWRNDQPLRRASSREKRHHADQSSRECDRRDLSRDERPGPGDRRNRRLAGSELLSRQHHQHLRTADGHSASGSERCRGNDGQRLRRNHHGSAAVRSGTRVPFGGGHCAARADRRAAAGRARAEHARHGVPHNDSGRERWLSERCVSPTARSEIRHSISLSRNAQRVLRLQHVCFSRRALRKADRRDGYDHHRRFLRNEIHRAVLRRPSSDDVF